MSQPAETAEQDAGAALAADCLARARAVLPVLDAAAGRIEQERELPADVLTALHEAALFRLTLPRPLGGAELDIARISAVMETVASADASTAWCLGQAAGCAMSAAFMAAPAAAQVFGPDDAVLAWGAGAVGEARAVPGGYRVTGRWPFASGSRHATWLGGHCKVVEADGTPRRGADGRRALRTALFPRAAAEITDDWQVMGLRGTGSDSYAVEALFVEDALTLDRETASECRHAAPLYLFPTTSVYAAAFAGVALGVARALLDSLRALAGHKTPRGAPGALRDSATFHTRLAEAEAKLGAARAYVQQVLQETWREVVDAETITLEQRIAIRLATTHAIQQATAVSESAYRMAGSSAIFDDGAFERRFRDAYAVSQQVQGRATNYETVGRHLMSLEVDTLFL